MAGENGAPLNRSSDKGDIEKAIREADGRERSPIVEGSDVPPETYVNFPFTEVKNLLAIEEDPLYKAALKEWDRKESYLGNRVDRREKASADLVNQIFNIVGFFSVFQGVVLTAVSQLKSDTFTTCGILWFPIVMSSVAAVVSIIGVSLKFLNLKELESSIYEEKVAQKEAAKRATLLRGEGKEHFRFFKHAKERERIDKKTTFHLSWIFVVLSLILFTALFIISYFAILCNSFVIHSLNGGLNRP